MEHIPQSESTVFEAYDITSWEYETSSEAINVARIKINGRYPESGFTSNTAVDSIVHIIDGHGFIETSTGKQVELAPHDQLHIAMGDEYFFEGNLELIYCATPKWTPEQTRLTQV